MNAMRELRYDRARRLREQPGVGHNRWHPDLTPVAFVEPGELILFETGDSSDAQLRRESTSHDVAAVNLDWGHPLTGPVYVHGAEPGDVLEIEIVAIEPSDWGWTALFPGVGLLPDLFPDPYLVIWEVDGEHARSQELPGVSVPLDAFPGVVGLAPSREEMGRFKDRERALAARGGRVAAEAPDAAFPPACADGLRTTPPREVGGNMDIRQLTPGSRLLLPVSASGGLLSVGDVHFAQGDGEVCGCGIEISATVTVRVNLSSKPDWRPSFPAYYAPPKQERASFAVTGIPILGDRYESMDLALATRSAVIQMVDWLVATRGLSREAAYTLCSVAVDLRLSEVVDIPHPIVSALIPLDIFDSSSA
jgi:formamidase